MTKAKEIPAELHAYYALANWLCDHGEWHGDDDPRSKYPEEVDADIDEAKRLAWNTGEQLIRCKRLMYKMIEHCEDYTLVALAMRELDMDIHG
jgi:hypothetical protein